ncbi:hypothetical protein A8806_106253 [Faecalicatena orotica]|uniref:Uncharacterized protein n=2 Tax=Faecalicatena orotica TaxID=1544 RepID=A0A2Y9BEP5_9FIRM|nr:hypothetical protein A8806_106253 [Faecalicatena orotica]SSA55969.1 hypothetical protein SAMN05216536_106253 [Faecalicatena orotica]
MIIMGDKEKFKYLQMGVQEETGVNEVVATCNKSYADMKVIAILNIYRFINQPVIDMYYPETMNDDVLEALNTLFDSDLLPQGFR